MLVIFKSKAAGDIIMYEANAKPIVEALGRDVEQGIILAEEAAAAIIRLEAEIARMKVVEAEEKARREAEEREKAKEKAKEKEDEDEDDSKEDDKWARRREPPPEPVSFAARAYPLLDMLKRAHKKKVDIVWGV